LRIPWATQGRKTPETLHFALATLSSQNDVHFGEKLLISWQCFC